MHDWNGNGKDDLFDRSVDYEIISGDEKKNDAKPEDKPKASPQTGSEVLGAVVIAVCIILFTSVFYIRFSFVTWFGGVL